MMHHPSNGMRKNESAGMTPVDALKEEIYRRPR